MKNLTSKQQLIKLQADTAEQLSELFSDALQKYPEFEKEIAVSFLNYSLKSILFASSPSEMAQATTSSLSAWLSFAQKLEEQEMAEIEEERVVFESSSSDAPDPELLFMDTTGLEPN